MSEIPPNLQAKLLRVLQEREFERVGGTKTIKVNVRILATSNRDLLQFVERGSFRSDLYYRLNVFPVHVTPLRERPEDIVLLAEAFLRRLSRKHGLKIPGFSDAAISALNAYPWPGNVRELQNTLERAVILSESGRPVSAAALGLPSLVRSFAAVGAPIPPVSTPAALPTSALSAVNPFSALESAATPPFIPRPSEPISPPRSTGAHESVTPAPHQPEAVIPLDEMEKRAILAALKSTGGNRTRAAELLNISIRTLRNKLQEYRASGDFNDAIA